MARRIHLQPYLSIDELEHRYRTAKEPNERTWWQILWLLAQGRTATELSAVIGYRAYWIGQIAKRYNEQGPEGMHNRRHTTSYRPAPVLSAEQQQATPVERGHGHSQHQFGRRCKHSLTCQGETVALSRRASVNLAHGAAAVGHESACPEAMAYPGELTAYDHWMT
jgi:hypothetical protein